METKRVKVIPPVPQREVREGIHAYTWSEAGLHVAVGLQDEEGVFLPGQLYDTVQIQGEDYLALLAADGGGELPGKPGGTFRAADLWPFIDRVRGRRQPGAPR